MVTEGEGERSRIELPPATLSIVSGRQEAPHLSCFLNPSLPKTAVIRGSNLPVGLREGNILFDSAALGVCKAWWTEQNQER